MLSLDSRRKRHILRNPWRWRLHLHRVVQQVDRLEVLPEDRHYNLVRKLFTQALKFSRRIETRERHYRSPADPADLAGRRTSERERVPDAEAVLGPCRFVY